MNSTRFFFVCIFIVGIAALSILLGRHNREVRSLCPNLACIQLDTASVFKVKEIYNDTPQTYRALYEHEQQILRVEAIQTSPKTATTELRASITKMKAMYEKAPAPYPGDVSDAIVCDPSFVPTYEEIRHDDMVVGIFVGYLNNRLTFGSCSQDQAVYKGILALTYCPQSKLLLRIERITPMADFTLHEKELLQQMKTFQCAK